MLLSVHSRLEFYNKVHDARGRFASVFHGGGEVTDNPFPNGYGIKGHKNGKYLDQQAIDEAVSRAETELVDPKTLSSAQRSVTKTGVEYYLTDGYKKTGETYADQTVKANRFPVVYEGTDLIGRTYRTILSGNHRATAALIQDEPLRAIVVRGKTTHPNGQVT
jgi:hypothetical protein